MWAKYLFLNGIWESLIKTAVFCVFGETSRFLLPCISTTQADTGCKPMSLRDRAVFLARFGNEFVGVEPCIPPTGLSSIGTSRAL
jgi:hypothetical protein